MGKTRNRALFWLIIFILAIILFAYFDADNLLPTGNIVKKADDLLLVPSPTPSPSIVPSPTPESSPETEVEAVVRSILEEVPPTEVSSPTPNPEGEENIKLANWNLQIFGDTKAADSELMNFYANTIEDYDIIFIQEIRDEDGSSFEELCSLLLNYQCSVSSRAGRSTSKEQYGVIYRKGINLIDLKDFNPDAEDRWERPPVRATFDINGEDLIVYNLHAKPEDVKNELNNLEKVVLDEKSVIILGDLNADCSYYNSVVNTEFDNWHWSVTDDLDTTVSNTDCAYDRIILNNKAYQKYINYGIYSEGIVEKVSDHYLVWVEMKF